jgi:hypothetical protein
LTNTTASAFLGLTYSCCQCHDHKYDPLSQADHYRLRAFFAGVVPKDGQVIETVEQLSRIQTHNAELDEQINRLNAEIAQLPAGESSEELKAETDRKVAELTSRKLSPRLGMAAVDTDGDIPATHVLYQGDFNSPREEVSPGFPSVLNPQPASIDAPHETTTGRRLALANWIVSDQNPWTARVLVNRIWQQHFGVGIVATPNDFGYTGGRPTHPELLDWLATEFQRQGWSVKRLHRLIVTSETYCQSSRQTTDDSAEVKADPHNQLLWRQNLRRLEAEALRDSLLAVSGLLQTHHSGRPRWPAVPEELLKAQPAILEAMKDDDGGRMQGWYTDPVEDTDVRSVFLIRKRSLPIPFLQAFDLPESTVSCARRETTVVAPQALFLLNSPEGIRFATALADRISQVVGDDTDTQITQLFRLALLRSPDQDERLLAVQFLTHHAAAYSKNSTPAASGKSALVDLCRAVLNSNEFVYVD